MNNTKTLCIFSPAFAKDEADTTWLPWLQSLVKSFNRCFPFLNIIIFSFEYPCVSKEYKWHNNLVFPFNGQSKTKLERIWMWFIIIKRFYQVKKRNDVRGILSLWCNETTFIAKCCSVLFRIEFRSWILGGDARSGNKFMKLIHPKEHELVAMSDFLQQEFHKNYRIKPLHVIPNGVDTSLFSDKPVAKNIDIVGAGSLSALKQYQIFVEVVRELKERFPNIKAVLCGGGEERIHLQHLIEKYNLKRNIFLTGKIPHNDVLLFMQRSRIFLHPSSYEGFSTVCLEALYGGAQVISFVKPMQHEIKNWHVVKTKEEMTGMALQILKDQNKLWEQILVYPIDESTKKIFKLFDSGN